MPASPTVLAKLLSPVSTAEFLDQHFLKLPYSRPGGCRDLLSLGDWPLVLRVLAAEGVDALAGRNGQRRPGASPQTEPDLRGLLAEGYTLGIRHAERHDAGLAELAEGFARDFAAPINVHLYCTPAEQPGFGWHYDAEDVFILQTYGRKEWYLRKNTVNPWPLEETLPRDMRYEREVTPLIHCTLDAGDWLYIPSGYWHRTAAVAESISLSVGILSPSAIDLLDHLRTRLLDSPLWRQRLPASGTASELSPEELRVSYRPVCRQLADDLRDWLHSDDFVQGFLEERRRGDPGTGT